MGVPCVGPWEPWKWAGASWPLLGIAQDPMVGTWCPGDGEMFLSTLLAGQVLGTKGVKGKRKKWRAEVMVASTALGAQGCQTGGAAAAGRGVQSWILVP